MVDTVRRDTDLVALLPDNSTQQIDANDLRDLCVSKLNIFPKTVAAAGTNQSTATDLTDHLNIVTSGTGGVNATASYTEVWNKTASPINVYPIKGVSAQFDALGTNAPVSVGANAFVRIVMTSTTQGYIV